MGMGTGTDTELRLGYKFQGAGSGGQIDIGGRKRYRAMEISRESVARKARVERPTTNTATTYNMTINTTISGVWKRRKHFASGAGRGKGKTTAYPHGSRDYYYCCIYSPPPHDTCRNAAIFGVRRTRGAKVNTKDKLQRLRITQNCIKFNLSNMQNSGGKRLWGRGDDRQGASTEKIFFTKHLCVNSKENSNLGWRTKSAGRNTEDALWGQKYREFNRVDVFLSKSLSSPRVLFEFQSSPHVL